MLKIAPWLLERLIKAGKINPSDVLTQSNLDDVLHLARELFGSMF